MRRAAEEMQMRLAEATRPTVLDRVISYVSPVRGARRLRARAVLALGGYLRDAKSRRVYDQWNPGKSDADSDILVDLPALRGYSRDLIRKNPIAAGAIKTKVTNIVGGGFMLKSQLDAEFLSIPEEKAQVWEQNTEREWRLFWNAKTCDAEGILTGNAVTRLVYRQAKENGDVFVLLPRMSAPAVPYSLRLQAIEADRVCNKGNAPDTDRLAGGVLRNELGAPVEYHVMRGHPGNYRRHKPFEWDTVPAFGSETGLPNIIHLFQEDRPGQSRGVPDLAPVIEPLKQLGRYTDAELMAAVISSYFTVFIKTESGNDLLDYTDMQSETGSQGVDTDKSYKLGSGAIIGLAKGESIENADPSRPNSVFDPFVLSILRQIGVALELPYELLVKHFTASYSAARAALLEGWKYFMSERRWLVENFLSIVYEVWMWEAVAIGRVPAPGFFADPAIRQAYLGAQWIGPSRGMINETDEVDAAQKRVDMGISTLAEETAQLTGGDWERKHPQRVREHVLRKAAGLIAENKPPQAAIPAPNPKEE